MIKSNTYQNDPLVYIVDGDLSYLRRKLKRGSTIMSRIVLRLDNNKYILRIFGYNLVMQSTLDFDRFEEVELMVKQVSPNFVLSVAQQNRMQQKHKGQISGHRNMDLFV